MLPAAIGLSAYCLIVLLCFERYVKAGVPFFLLGSFAVALAPVALYISLRSPLIFPFCLYVLFLPFDSLSSLGKGGTLTKLLGIVSAGAILINVMRRGNLVPPPRAMMAWLALLALMGVSIFWSIEPSSATIAFETYASLIGLYALLSIVRVKPFEFKAILTATVVAGVISAGYDAYLYRSSQGVINAGAGAMRVIVSSGNAMIDPNALAAALVLPFAIGLYWLFNSRFWWLRALMLPALAVLLLGFAASGSRGGFIDLAAVFAYLIIRSRHRLWLGGLMLASVACALIANPGLPARFQEAQQDGGAGRSDIWHVGLYALRDHWVIGAGVGNFPAAYDQEYLHVFARYVLGWHWVAHNVPLQISTELGALGVLIFAIATGLQFTVLRRCRANSPVFELRLTLEAACIGVLVAGLSISSLTEKFVWLVFSLMSLLRSCQISSWSGLRVDAPLENPPVAPLRVTRRSLRRFTSS